MDTLIYIGIIIGLFALGCFGIYLKKKFNLKEEDIQHLGCVLDITNYINKNFEYKFKKNVSLIIQYFILAIKHIEDFDDGLTIEEMKVLSVNKAKQICSIHGIEIDEKFEEIIDKTIDYILNKYYKISEQI